ncbi:MAG TPA: hypothetical protein VK522_13815 [Pseudolabrys sp.]|nr:hypothetical protein [Pseudolabrys sp.]
MSDPFAATHCVNAQEGGYIAGSTVGTVGIAVAPALYTTAVVIMLTPLG